MPGLIMEGDPVTPIKRNAVSDAPEDELPALPDPVRLTLARYTAPFDELRLVTDERDALRWLSIGTDETPLRAGIGRRYPGVPLGEGQVPAPIRDALDRYFAGDPAALERVDVAAAGTPFQRRVWAALRRIPAGQTASYRDIATALGNPMAVRAVGGANGANPVGIVVPCHRVITHDGLIGGYSGGLERKRWLLAHEGYTGKGVGVAQAPLVTDRLT
jgi:methylated-DNA-[protein]-cysteine S-methyltransferase